MSQLLKIPVDWATTSFAVPSLAVSVAVPVGGWQRRDGREPGGQLGQSDGVLAT